MGEFSVPNTMHFKIKQSKSVKAIISDWKGFTKCVLHFIVYLLNSNTYAMSHLESVTSEMKSAIYV